MKIFTLRELSDLVKEKGSDSLSGAFETEGPVLLCDPKFAPEEDIDFGATMRLGPEETHSGETRSPWSSLADGKSVVVPLVKSDRNPFAGVIAVGRREDNDVVLKANSVSKLHALFKHTSEGWSLQDNNSKNGTFINHERLEGKESVRLKSGDEVRFGLVRGMFVMQSELITLCSYVRAADERSR